MSVALLDVNVLLALFDQSHVHFDEAHRWFRIHSREGWATCPITVNGCVRIFGLAGYTNTRNPSAAAKMLRLGLDHPSHEFWADSISVLDENLFALEHVHSSRQLTDIYLLALAVRRNGHLVTFDRSIPLRAVVGAKASHLKILGSTTRY